jgi:hypothetical protein
VRAAVRPFRLAALALAGPLAPLEALLRAAERLPAALKLELGLLDVSPFGALAGGPADGAALADEAAVRAGARRAARAAAAPRPAAGRRATMSTAPPTSAAEVAAAELTPGAAVRAALAGTPAAAEAPGAAATALLGRLADAALEAVTPAAGPAGRRGDGSRRPPSHGAARVAAVGEAAGRAEVVTPGPGAAAPRAAAPPSLLEELAETALAAEGPVPAEGGAPIRLQPPAVGESLERAAPDVVPPGTASSASPAGGERSPLAGLAARLGAESAVPGETALAGGSLLGDHAETALAGAVPAPAAPAAEQPESPVLRRRSDGEEAVARALDRAEAAAGAVSRASVTRENATPTAPVVEGTAAAAHVDLAWLVNEALVEQARRHGVDLS